jgi:hypothetical protein
VNAGRQTAYHAQPSGNGRRVIANPRYHAQRPWDWNRGVAWAPAAHYWGGGFWGSFALDAAAVALGAAAFGTFAYNNAVLTSYQVAPGSPGATLLANYQLTQTPCGPPDLVVQYDLDPQTLTIVSE